MSSSDLEQTLCLTTRYTARVHELTKTKQKLKFEKLWNENSKVSRPVPDIAPPQQRCVVNLRKRPISEIEQRVLGLGLNDAIAPKRLPTLDIIAGVEQGLSKANLGAGSCDIRMAVHQTLRNARQQPKLNLTADENRGIKSLRTDESVVIIPADKGNATVILETAMTRRSSPY